MDLLKVSHKEFLLLTHDIHYDYLNGEQKLTMIKIMYRLKTWITKSQNTKYFVELYGRFRLHEINVIWHIYEVCMIKDKYYRDSYYRYNEPFAMDFVKYLIGNDIHTIITLNGIRDYLRDNKFNHESSFYRIISSYEGAGDMYYLVLLKMFCNIARVYIPLYNNVNDKELFAITMFRYANPDSTADFVDNAHPRPTQELMDIFIGNIITGKYHGNNTDGILYIIKWFRAHDFEMPYDKLVCNKHFVDICKKDMRIMAPNMCDIIAQFSNDDVSFLKVVIRNNFIYNSHTIKLATYNDNVNCAKYMEKHIEDKK